MANALVKEGREMLALIPPRGSVAAAVQAALPEAWWRPPSTTCRPRKWRTSTSGLEADVLVCSDHPEATAATVALVERIGAARRSTPAA